jgi:hypothetical protein
MAQRDTTPGQNSASSENKSCPDCDSGFEFLTLRDFFSRRDFMKVAGATALAAGTMGLPNVLVRSARAADSTAGAAAASTYGPTYGPPLPTGAAPAGSTATEVGQYELRDAAGRTVWETVLSEPAYPVAPAYGFGCASRKSRTAGPNAVEIDVTVCSFDHPENVTPGDHTWVDDRLPWIRLADELPIYGQKRQTHAT